VSASGGLHGHQVIVSWQGQDIVTLAPLWPQPLRAVIVGINPAKDSARAGHYYQGPMGKDAIALLREVGILAPARAGVFADTAAQERGIGFTDMVPRPTRRGEDLDRDEKRLGGARLRSQIAVHRPPVVLAVFREPVEALLGRRYGSVGLQSARFEGIPVFKLPVRFTPRAERTQAVEDLAALWRELYPNDRGVR